VNCPTTVRGNAGRQLLPLAILAALVDPCLADVNASSDPTSPPDWVQDALVVAMPAAAVGGCQAGIYTPAVNGVRPWKQALIC